MMKLQLRQVLSSVFVLCLATALVQAGSKSKDKQIADEDITSAVTTRLIRDPAVSSHLIDVETEENVVRLSGSVDNILAKKRAVKWARALKGVRAVIDQIRVKPVIRSDKEIREDVHDALLFDPATDSYEVSAAVNNGRVTLTGTVQSWQEKQLAEHVVMGVRGVKEVDNNINVVYKTDRPDGEIRAEIRRRLETDIWVDDGLIDVAVEDGKVTLTGTVGSAAEKYEAYADAWVRGVESVDFDKLEVQWWARDKMRRNVKTVLKSDSAVTKAVRDAFLYDPRVNSFNPTVSVENGVVTLTGVVDNLKAKQAAAEDARNTLGVYRVKNHLRVRPMKEYSDEQIARNVRSALLWDPDVSRYEISVSVFNGKVYLAGEVDTYFEKWQAEDVASRVNGVIDVANNISVDYDPVAEYPRYPSYRTYPYSVTSPRNETLKEDIRDELWWSPYVDSTKILVSVEDGVATLSGTVSSWQEMNMAIENALEAGADNVVNDLRIRSKSES